jgi:hypothetical protein
VHSSYAQTSYAHTHTLPYFLARLPSQVLAHCPAIVGNEVQPRIPHLRT